MHTIIVRSLIAGSFSAVASLAILGGSSALASGGVCDPIYIDYGDGLASVAYPDFCDDTFVAPLFPIDLIPMPIGVDLIPTLCTPLDLADCADPDDPAIGDELIGELDELPAESDDLPVGFDDLPVDTTPDTTPDTAPDTTPDTTPTDPAADSDDPILVDTAEVEEAPVTADTATVPTELPQTPSTPNEPELPRTGSDSTPLVIGAGMVILGLGLGFTSVSMTRRRRTV